MAPVLALDYIDLKIDTDRHINGKAVAEGLTGGASVGYPWSVILDADGKALVTSVAPGDGNIGCPVTDEEQAWFIEMLDRSRQHMGDEALRAVAAELKSYAESLRRR